MKINLNKIILTTGISILSMAVRANDTGMANSVNDTNGTMNMPVTAQHFVWEAGMANLKEVRLSELALDKSDNADVKSFAKHMVRDHTAANKKLMKLAEKENLNFPDTNTFSENWNSNFWYAFNETNNVGGGYDTNSIQATSNPRDGQRPYRGAELLVVMNEEGTTNDVQTFQSLAMLSGAQFDQAYVEKMYRDHVQAINKFQNAAANLTDEDLKKYAQKTLPTLREHYRMVQELSAKLNGTQNLNASANSMKNMNTTAPIGAMPQ